MPSPPGLKKAGGFGMEKKSDRILSPSTLTPRDNVCTHRRNHMRPLKRNFTNKRHSAKTFRKNTSRTHRLNMGPTPNRGGFRL